MTTNKKSPAIDIILKLCIAVGALLAGISIAYYIFIYTPKAASDTREAARKQEAYNECKQIQQQAMTQIQNLSKQCETEQCMSNIVNNPELNAPLKSDFITNCIPGRLKQLP